MNNPSDFTGDQNRLEEWIMEVEMFLTMNEDLYDTHQKKIIYALSYMKEGATMPCILLATCRI